MGLASKLNLLKWCLCSSGCGRGSCGLVCLNLEGGSAAFFFCFFLLVPRFFLGSHSLGDLNKRREKGFVQGFLRSGLGTFSSPVLLCFLFLSLSLSFSSRGLT